MCEQARLARLAAMKACSVRARAAQIKSLSCHCSAVAGTTSRLRLELSALASCLTSDRKRNCLNHRDVSIAQSARCAMQSMQSDAQCAMSKSCLDVECSDASRRSQLQMLASLRDEPWSLSKKCKVLLSTSLRCDKTDVQFAVDLPMFVDIDMFCKRSR